MSLEKNVDELIKESELMAKCYYKGFGNDVATLIYKADKYVRLQDPTFRGAKTQTETPEELRQKCFELLGYMQDFYSGIPFDSLHGNEKFYPLFVARTLLDQCKDYLELTFSSGKMGSYMLLGNCLTTIKGVGNLYGQSFKELMQDIRSHKGYENYVIEITDRKGTKWRCGEDYLID